MLDLAVMKERFPDHFKPGKKRARTSVKKNSIFHTLTRPNNASENSFLEKAAKFRDATLAGGIALVAAGTYAKQEGKIDAQNEQLRAEKVAEQKVFALEEELRQERKNSIKQSAPDFHEQILEKVIERTPDMTRVWLNGFSPDTSLEGRSKHSYLKAHFLSEGSGSMPETIAAPLRSLIGGLVATESRFDSRAVSQTNAFGAVQVVPSTFRDWHTFAKGKEIPPGTYEEYRKKFIADFKEQVEFLNWYFPYMYDRLLEDDSIVAEFGKIQEKFFPDDEEGFERYFIAPLLLNAYNAGFGTMKELVEGVRGKVRSFNETHPHSILGQKYLAFYLLTEETDYRDPKNAVSSGRYFDAEKHGYVREIFAFDELLANMIQKGGPHVQLASNVKKSERN